jgi:hypothetical protein
MVHLHVEDWEKRGQVFLILKITFKTQGSGSASPRTCIVVPAPCERDPNTGSKSMLFHTTGTEYTIPKGILQKVI